MSKVHNREILNLDVIFKVCSIRYNLAFLCHKKSDGDELRLLKLKKIRVVIFVLESSFLKKVDVKIKSDQNVIWIEIHENWLVENCLIKHTFKVYKNQT